MQEEVFRFKHFTIRQNSASVFKVNSEAILLAAWVDLSPNINCILEIGSGTGLISLGLCQRLNAYTRITAIDIDHEASKLTQLNVQLNGTKNIQVRNHSLQDLGMQSEQKYDLVISNPPYFNTRIKSEKARNITAKYTDTLNFHELLFYSKKLLSDNGKIALVLPYESKGIIEEECNRLSLMIIRACSIRPKEGKKMKRILLEIIRREASNENLILEEINILDSNGQYTQEYIQLTQDYYTIF